MRRESSTECRCSQCQLCLFLPGSAGLMSVWFTIRPYSCACIPFGKGCGEEFATRITLRQGMRCAACRECDPGLRPSYIYIHIYIDIYMPSDPYRRMFLPLGAQEAPRRQTVGRGGSKARLGDEVPRSPV